jgi:ATP-dependent helicase/nuclease subunit B
VRGRPPAIDAGSHSLLLVALARAAADHPLDDKLLVCRPRGVGRELLHRLASAGQAWLGFRVQTPWELSAEIAAGELARRGLSPIDRFEEIALLDQAIDEVLESKAGAVLRELGDAVGFRNALAGAVRELRLAGIDGDAIGKSNLEDAAKKKALAAIQRAYETALSEARRVDRADVLRSATKALEASAPLPAERIYLVPGMHLRGLRGGFLAALQGRGAEVLETDPVVGAEQPAALLYGRQAQPAGRLSYLYAVEQAPAPGARVDLFTPEIGELEIGLFAAASPVDELREVLRRVMAAGVPWDDVEVIATDPVVYGTALDSIAPRLVGDERGASRATHAAGLPIARTRTGRAVAGYLRWIREDFPEEIIRSLIHAGVVRPTTAAGEQVPIGGPRLARALRELRIGWGRERFLRQIEWGLEKLEGDGDLRESRNRGVERLEADRRRRRDELEALRALFIGALEATPPTPDRLGAAGERVAAGAVAVGLLAFLELVDTPSDPDTEAEAKRRLVEVLRRAAATLQRPAGFGAATAVIERLIDLRVPSPSTHGRVPWSSAGGYLHFADLDHGGLSGRPYTFVVGLDASRSPGSGRQDPLLLDHDRGRLAPGSLPRAGELLEERRYALAALLARLRGRVTFSYSAWDASEGRNLSPSPVMLQALRLRSGDPAADYRALHAATRPICGPVPAGSGLLDGIDAWLHKLDEGQGRLRHGVDVVRRAYPGLDAGLRARDESRAGRLNAHTGAVAPRPELLDPRQQGGGVLLSASRLETLATCPLRYLFRYVLQVPPLDDIEFEPDRWLDPRQRGSLFHSVYERALSEASGAGIDAASPRLAALAAAILEDEIGRARHLVPVPSEAVFERERRGLRDDLEVFLEMLREEDGRWLAVEWRFGFAGDEAPGVAPAAELRLPSGAAVYLRGAVDRIDELPGGKLAIVDYKTGGTWGYGEESGVYSGGRRLQHALYTHAVEQLFGRRVERAAYHFPTRKGEGHRLPYERARLDRWPEILEQLFDMIAAGWFPPPFDKEVPCKFCDFKAICRVREDNFGKVHSPPVAWAQANNLLLAEYTPLQRIRKIDD